MSRQGDPAGNGKPKVELNIKMLKALFEQAQNTLPSLIAWGKLTMEWGDALDACVQAQRQRILALEARIKKDGGK